MIKVSRGHNQYAMEEKDYIKIMNFIHLDI